MKAEPSGNPSPQKNERLSGLRESLLFLHKTLMDSERATYEAVFGTIPSKNQYLRLLLEDPWFVWLRSISELIVHIDEAMDAEAPVSEADVKQLHERVRSLLRPTDEGVGFAKQYFDALQRDPDVVMAHAEVIKRLG